MIPHADIELLTGNRLTALGALAAGCRFFAGYPITPSSEIYQTMMEELPTRGGLALAAPDEISALAACVGASLAGHRAMTATSGPGFALMVETVQYAVMTETPVVVVLVQRLGPSTGGATQGGQGDLLLVRGCVSGGYTVPVFAPSDGAGCYELIQVAFDWSERLRSPVILLSDKEVGMTAESTCLEALARIPVAARRPFTGEPSRFRPYATPCDTDPPEFAPVGGEARVVATGSAHDTWGRLRKNSPEVLGQLRRLQAKIDAHAREMERVRHERVPGARTLLVSFGVTSRAARDACAILRHSGTPASHVAVESLLPVPEESLARALEGIERVVVVEENLTGLYADLLAPRLGNRTLVRVNAIGAAISPATIAEAAREARR